MTAHFMSKGEKPPDPHMTGRQERGKVSSTKGEAPVIGPTEASMKDPATTTKQGHSRVER